MNAAHDTPPQSRHFHLTPLAGGVYAAMSIDGSGSMCNAGIILILSLRRWVFLIANGYKKLWKTYLHKGGHYISLLPRRDM